MKAKIIIMPKKGILDPQGEAVNKSLATIGYDSVENVRVGKVVNILINKNKSEVECKKMIDDMCKKLLVNTIVEDYTYEVLE